MNIDNEKSVISNQEALDIYRKEMLYALKLSFPQLYQIDLERAIEYSIKKRFKDTNVTIDNNYEKWEENSTLLNVTNYIIEREPIITVSGVMFKKHGSCRNPFVELVREFLDSRELYKNKMYQYPKGSEDFEKYNLLQLSEKVSGSALYGAAANCTSIFYNIYMARTITMQGRDCISTAIMLFESMLANNVKFGSLNEVIMFINNVRRESELSNESQDMTVLDSDVTVENCFMKIITTCGFYYIPSEQDMMIIWDMLNQMTQHEINRLYYKNNLFYFVDNKYVFNMVVDILSSLDVPFIDPNKPPECIKDKLSDFYELIKEWVYYDKQYIDRFDKAKNMYRAVAVYTHTDSCFISFDGWYRYILDKAYSIPMKIKEIEIDQNSQQVQRADSVRYDYNFYTDEVIELENTIRPNIIGPAVGFRCSIINILAHIMGKLSIDYMNKYSRNSNSTIKSDGTERTSFFILKNEFQIKRSIIIPDVKKTYCAYQERQESSIIPVEKAMSITGMPLDTISIPESTKNRLKAILFDYVLNTEEISQIDIVKQLAVFEKQIFQEIMNGSKEYFKPARIKSKAAYKSPMSTGPIKASVAYNNLKEENKKPIDLSQRNTVIVIKTIIDKSNIDKIIDIYPEQYKKMEELLKNQYFSKGIENVAIPENEPVPEWLKPFINYTEIINNNLSVFPCEALGIDRKMNKNVNYTNIISL